MLSSNKTISEEDKLKEKLISLTQLNRNYVNFLKVSTSKNEYVHVTMIDNFTIKNKPNLVLFHGLTGTAFCYFKMFNELSEHFVVYAVDLPGQGLSSRIEYNYLDRDKAEEYFLSRFEILFQKLKLKRINLVSHSFSGYLAGLFYIKHPELINRLIFLSPIGLCSSFKELNICNAVEDFMQTLAFKFKKAANDGVKMFGVLSKPFFNKYCERKKFKGLTDEEYETLKSLLYCLIQKEYSSDPSVYSLFDKSLKAFKPLSLYLDKFKLCEEILIIYGDNDWCPAVNGEEFQRLVGDNKVKIEILSNCNHMMQTDNYEELNTKIINFLIKTE
jgi:pimeloyl-ACP methyl ester carboxylesterase